MLMGFFDRAHWICSARNNNGGRNENKDDHTRDYILLNSKKEASTTMLFQIGGTVKMGLKSFNVDFEAGLQSALSQVIAHSNLDVRLIGRLFDFR